MVLPVSPLRLFTPCTDMQASFRVLEALLKAYFGSETGRPS